MQTVLGAKNVPATSKLQVAEGQRLNFGSRRERITRKKGAVSWPVTDRLGLGEIELGQFWHDYNNDALGL